MSQESIDKFGVFWYNDEEILNWQSEDYDRKAASLAESGINIVMTFSCTHFRWSFYPWWPQITAALKKLTEACHHHGIRVVEHHSSQLTFNPRSAKEWETVRNYQTVRHSSLDSFPGLRRHIAEGDPEIAQGIRLSDCRQIDGRTGDYVRSSYIGYAHCYNNPYFRKAYLDYLAMLYRETGIDGIMTDDVHFFGRGNGCTCPYCRRKFREETGYELPQPEQWGNFAGHYENPVFISWLKFLHSSADEFQRSVSLQGKNLGLSLIRPNYTVSVFLRNITGYPFESTGELWSHVFQENMFSTIIRTGWPWWSCDAAQRVSMARYFHSCPMSMFYPSRRDDYYFCWSLARLWGHLLMATPEGGDLNEVEKQFHRFEQLHFRKGENADPLAELAFLHPRASLDYTEDSMESSTRPLTVWMEGAVFQNLRFGVLAETADLSAWLSYPMVVICGATMLSDQQLALMQQYRENGGRLLIFGAFGIYHPDGSRREHPERIFGLEAQLESQYRPAVSGHLNWEKQRLTLPDTEESLCFSCADHAEVIARDGGEQILGISTPDHRLIWLAGGVRSRHPAASHYGMNVSRWSSEKKRIAVQDNVSDYLRNVPGEILRMLLPEPQVIRCSEKDCRVSIFSTENHDRYVIHAVNTADTLAAPPQMVSHEDLFVHFLTDSQPNAAPIEIRVSLSACSFRGRTARASSPEWEDEKMLPVSISGNELVIRIPEGTFAGYLRMELK